MNVSTHCVSPAYNCMVFVVCNRSVVRNEPLPITVLWLCNDSRFGPPAGVTLLSACPGLDHSVSGLPASTSRPFKTRFPYGSLTKVNLANTDNSLTHYTKGTQSLFRAPTACTHTVSDSISLPLQGFFSPFPHGTGSLSVVW